MRTAAGWLRARLVVSCLAVTLVATACGGGENASGEPDEEVSEEVSIGLITQLSQADYFAVSAEGAEEEAERLGVQLDVVDSGLDQDRVVSLVDTFATQGADAVIIVPSNTDIGPAVTDIAAGAGLHVVASDSPLQDADGNPVPFVGMNNTQAGEQVGEILARIFSEEDWSLEETYFAAIEAPFQVCLERTDAALDVFTQDNPDLPEANVVKVPYEGLVDEADDAMRAALTANPDAEYWLVVACNDAGVIGALQAMEAAEFPVENVIGVGLGGDQACLAFSSPYIMEGMRASTWNDPKSIGAATVRVAYDLAQGKEVDDITYVETPEINIDNYAEAVGC